MKSITITGHIGQDAVTKDVNGKKFVEFPVAVNESYSKNDGTKVESTTWFTCTTKTLSLAPFLKKGDPVAVHGNFKVNAFRDNQGDPKVGVDVYAYNVQLLASKKDEENETGMAWLQNLIRKEVKKVKEAVM
jgi:single-strand DNA-binding protein